ncbi:MAG: DUF2652 domain-containing protein [Ignavibacteria bacterium]|nr:DUF2652 domain-containing protein [Ignavibacteria bacterium]
MAQNANIFIPDISGYTEFLTRTELEHSSHILNELLRILVDSNCSDLTLLEIEGDALLFYKKGAPLSFDQMVRQCVEMYRSFHTRLRIIERDSVCQCGACRTASNLTLKFVVHYGEISEISVASFVKAAGINMVIAHRLLKNRIDSHEYILATEDYCTMLPDHASIPRFSWKSGSEEYPAVGTITFRYALLDQIRASVSVTDRPPVSVTLTGDRLSVEINKPMAEVYRAITDLENRSKWVHGLKRSEGTDPLDRLHSVHYCHFDDSSVEIVPLEREVSSSRVRYVESGGPAGTDRKTIFAFELTPKTGQTTVVTAQIGSPSADAMPDEAVGPMLERLSGSMESLKLYLEGQ